MGQEFFIEDFYIPKLNQKRFTYIKTTSWIDIEIYTWKRFSALGKISLEEDTTNIVPFNNKKQVIISKVDHYGVF